MSECDAPNFGDHVVVQRQSYMKLHKLAASGSVKLGKCLVLTDGIVGKPFWTTYRMDPKKDKKGVFNLVECSLDDDHCQALMKDISSGVDNRNIVDDGSSQKLSSDEIIGMRDEGLSSKEIVGTLIENSTTFQVKTEYSQEKYLKKKEKKYFEYITIRKPTLRLIADIMYKQDPLNIMGLRSDTLSQLATAVNLHPHGTYIMYESGCQSLASAAILNGLSSEGRLILTHPGSNPQRQAIQGMNLSTEQMDRLIYVNIYALLRRLVHKESITGEKNSGSEVKTAVQKGEPHSEKIVAQIKKDPSSEEIVSPITKEHTSEETVVQATKKPSSEETVVQTTKEPSSEETAEQSKKELSSEETGELSKKEPSSEETVNGCAKTMKEPGDSQSDPPQGEMVSEMRKRKHSGDDETVETKRPRYLLEIEKAVTLLKAAKADGLIIVCKEHPANILEAFLPFVGPSKNFVVYGSMREPLQELSMDIRKRPDVIYVQLSEMWLRNYQVMENRTHPFVSMSGGGGYLLTGVVVQESPSNRK